MNINPALRRGLTALSALALLGLVGCGDADVPQVNTSLNNSVNNASNNASNNGNNANNQGNNANNQSNNGNNANNQGNNANNQSNNGNNVNNANNQGNGCTSDRTCGAGSFCDRAACDAAEGTCVVRPDDCTLDEAPVCGCDGVTYSNDCARQGAGVSLAHEGACEVDPRACTDNDACGDGGFCERRSCEAGAEGECLAVPGFCTEEEDPVCGCDGVTYGNDCARQTAGVPLDHEGACEVDPGDCAENADCDDDAFCERSCDEVTGACTPRPQGCPDVVDPVCGCDGVTYGNDCERQAAGAPLAYAGECMVDPTRCGSNADCGRGFCEFEGGTCDADDRAGVCLERPDVCPRILMPVCGCDGVTYGNDCERQRAGAALDHEGRCDADPTRCDSNAACSSDEVCVCEGACGESGTCQPVQVCNDDRIDPVCGCDGLTYATDCDRQNAGVCLAHDGACGRLDCGGASGRQCEPGQFCDTPLGVCSGGTGAGTCVEAPRLCPRIYDPVCGCDGNTYGNDCERIAAGVEAQYDGPCVEERRCRSDQDCTSRELFCEFDPGTCPALERVGTCEFIPRACPDVYDPVCGCDGVTYSNDCERQMAHASVNHQGPCDLSDFCRDNTDCTDREFCECARSCGDAGQCQERPQGCPDVVAPVCGCDGITYGNDCERQAAGTCLGYTGECERPRLCGTLTGDECLPGEICDPFPGTCLFADGGGVCIIPPTACPDIYDPVCGCDGVTYSNDCERQMARVGPDHAGECANGGDACRPGEPGTCGREGFCDIPAGTCRPDDTTEGQCVQIPRICPLALRPVCGCDGVTYGNDCERQMAGVYLDHDGACNAQRCSGDARDCGRGQFCDLAAGTCDLDPANRQGACVPIPEGCPRLYDPVCGCDGVTYGNDCNRIAAGADLAYAGECRNERTCRSDADCLASDTDRSVFCELPDGLCGGTGFCVQPPNACPADVIDFVCGCDFVTYNNDCERQRASVSLLSAGRCR